MNSKNPALIVSVGAAVAVAAIIGLSAAGAAGTTALTTPTALEAPAKSAPIPFIGAPNYRAIVAANRAAVVGITTESKGRQVADDSDEDDQSDEQDQGNGNPRSNGRGNPGIWLHRQPERCDPHQCACGRWRHAGDRDARGSP